MTGDAEAVRTIRRALELGVTFIDAAENYFQLVLGQVRKGRSHRSAQAVRESEHVRTNVCKVAAEVPLVQPGDLLKRRPALPSSRSSTPDDQIIAGTWALTGRPVWLDLLHAASLLRVVPLLGRWVPPVELLVPVAGRRTYVAVMRRRLICIRLSWPKNKPGQVVLDVPVYAARISGGRRGLVLDSVRYAGPGDSDLGIRAPSQWRSDLDEVLAALRAGGASVELNGAQRNAIGVA